MLARSRKLTMLTAVALTMGACGDDLPTGNNSGDELEEAEVEALVVEFFDILEQIDVEIPGLRLTDPRLFLSRTAVPVPVDETFSGSDPCDAGGDVSYSGTAEGEVDDETNEGEVTVEATFEFDDCEIVGETVTYTVQGDPEIGVVADFEITEETVTVTLDAGGGFAFTTDDEREGTCSVDISVTLTVSGTTITETVSGTVCGVDASDFDTELFDEGF